MDGMQKPDLDADARNRRVQDLCRELGQLLVLSQEQRRYIDHLLTQLEAVTRAAKSRLRLLTKTAGASGPAGGTKSGK